MLKLLAIDPSLTCNGIAFADQTTYAIRPPAKMAGVERLIHLRQAVVMVIQQANPDAVILEGYSYGSKGASVINIGEWGGVLRVLLHELGLPVAEIPPANLKQFVTGKGNSKKAVLISELSNLASKSFATEDEADAWALAAMAYDYCGEPWIKIPQARRASQDKVQWPAIMQRLRRI